MKNLTDKALRFDVESDLVSGLPYRSAGCYNKPMLRLEVSQPKNNTGFSTTKSLHFGLRLTNRIFIHHHELGWQGRLGKQGQLASLGQFDELGWQSRLGILSSLG